MWALRHSACRRYTGGPGHCVLVFVGGELALIHRFIIMLAIPWLIASSTGCSSASRPPQRTVASVTSLPPQHAPHFAIRAPYVATLMTALAAVSGGSAFSRASRWAPWVAPWDKDRPHWMKEFGKISWRLRSSPYYRHLVGGGKHYEMCGYYDVTVKELIACLKALSPPIYHEVIETAVRRMDEKLRPHWDVHHQYLQKFSVELTTIINTPATIDLIYRLREFWDLKDEIPLSFETVLVLTPPNAKYLEAGGQHNAGHLVLAVNPEADVSLHRDVFFHELCHLGQNHTRYQGAFEGGLNQETAGAPIAARYWGEVVASAFGSGIAAERFEGSFDVTKKRFYYHPWIDPLGREFYLYWRRHPELRFGVESGRAMSLLAQKIRPPAKWVLSEHLARLFLIAEDDQIYPIVAHALRGSIIYRRKKYRLSSGLAFRIQQKTLPLVFVFENKRLADNSWFLSDIETTREALLSAVGSHRSAYYWHVTAKGRRVLVVTADTMPVLRKASGRLFGKSNHVQLENGWHAIP